MTDLIDTLRQTNAILHQLAVRHQIAGADDAPGATISDPDSIYRLVGPEMASLAQEQFRLLLLNIKNEVVQQHVIYQGTVDSITIRIAEVLRPAVIAAVPNIAVVHNHPSGDPTPSPQDIGITRRLNEASKLLDIELLDHVIVGRRGFVSLKARGLGF